MFDHLNSLLAPPLMDASGGESFWVDEYISAQLLGIHLDPGTELASRNPELMDRSVRWIAGLNPPGRFPRLLDIGCGPGLYAQRFARAGYRVTGVDFSRRSIAYARDRAREAGLGIDYRNEDYRMMEPGGPYDLAVMIYCDYGALPESDRLSLLRKAHAALRPGGRFLLDVLTDRFYSGFTESRTWEAVESGFWSAGKTLVFNASLKYPQSTTLHQAVVLTDGGAKSYYIWNHCFSPESLAAEALEAGFHPVGVFGDVAGAPYGDGSLTLAALLEK